MKKVFWIALTALVAGFAWAEPVVDGKVAAGEYALSKKVIQGKGLLSWASDGKGGLYIAYTAQGKGWAGVGLGAQEMNGAYIYFGFVGADGKVVFSEQMGKAHRHSDSGKKTADHSAVVLAGGATTLEFHVPAASLPFTGKTVNFITAFSDSADMMSFHGGNYDMGSFPLP
jgi:hypothetical protein